MTQIKEQLIQVWMRNQLANEQVMEELDSLDMNDKVVSKVYAQFSHIHTIRFYNIEKQDKSLLNGLVKLSGTTSKDKDLVKYQLQLSCQLIAQIIQQQEDISRIKGYQNGCIAWITYLINHESHHRSKVMMLMKEQGVSFSKRLKFDLWNWK